MVILPALQFWARRSELSADRAGLLACQDVSVAVTALAKLGGMPRRYTEDFEAEDLIAQAKRLDELYDADGISRALVALDQTFDSHPRMVWRVKTMMQWVDSGEFGDLVEASRSERDTFRERIDDDPSIAQFLDMAVQSILAWSSPQTRADGMRLLREVRRMVRIGRPPTLPPLSDIFSVRLEIERHEAKYEVAVTLYLVQDGHPRMIVLPSAHAQSWSKLPEDVRNAILRTGKPLKVASATVTAGLRCAPLSRPAT